MNHSKRPSTKALKADFKGKNVADFAAPASATKWEERGDKTRKREPIGSRFLVHFILASTFL